MFEIGIIFVAVSLGQSIGQDNREETVLTRSYIVPPGVPFRSVESLLLERISENYSLNYEVPMDNTKNERNKSNAVIMGIDSVPASVSFLSKISLLATKKHRGFGGAK
jgi:hypothetical protein